MKRVYYVKWKDTVVGEIKTNEEGKNNYVPNVKNIDKLKMEGMPSALVGKAKDGTLPTFIEKRMKLNVKDKKTATDDFSIVKA